MASIGHAEPFPRRRTHQGLGRLGALRQWTSQRRETRRALRALSAQRSAGRESGARI